MRPARVIFNHVLNRQAGRKIVFATYPSPYSSYRPINGTNQKMISKPPYPNTSNWLLSTSSNVGAKSPNPKLRFHCETKPALYHKSESLFVRSDLLSYQGCVAEPDSLSVLTARDVTCRIAYKAHNARSGIVCAAAQRSLWPGPSASINFAAW